MARIVSVRSTNRSAKIRVRDTTGTLVRLSADADTRLDLDLLENREALGHHSAVGQYNVLPDVVAAVGTTIARFAAPTPIVGVTASDRAYSARTFTEARMRCATAPVGSALTAQLQSSTDGTSWNTVTTLSIASGSTTEAVQAISLVQSVGALLRLNVTSIGTTTPATGVVVDVH